MIIGLLGNSGVGKDTIAELIAPVHLVKNEGQWEDVRPKAELTPNTRAQHHMEPLRMRAVQVALADPLKEYCREVYDFSSLQLWGPSHERNRPDKRYPREERFHSWQGEEIDGPCVCSRCGTQAPSPSHDGPCVHYLSAREALQQLGTEWGRRMYPDTWVRYGMRRAKQLVERQRIDRPKGAHTFTASWVIDRTELVVISDIRFLNEVKTLHTLHAPVWKVVRPSVDDNGFSAHLSETEQKEHAAEIETMVTTTIVNDGGFTDLRKKVQEALREVGA